MVDGSRGGSLSGALDAMVWRGVAFDTLPTLTLQKIAAWIAA